MFLSCHNCGTEGKILSPHGESNLRPLHSVLQYSIFKAPLISIKIYAPSFLF